MSKNVVRNSTLGIFFLGGLLAYGFYNFNNTVYTGEERKELTSKCLYAHGIYDRFIYVNVYPTIDQLMLKEDQKVRASLAQSVLEVHEGIPSINAMCGGVGFSELDLHRDISNYMDLLYKI